MYTISTKRQLPVISQINILILPLTFHPYLVIGALYSSILDINTIKKKNKKKYNTVGIVPKSNSRQTQIL
jgi:hypothetical protein